MFKKLKSIFLLSAVLALAPAALRADTTTTRAGLTKPSIGSSGWGVKWNSNADLIDSLVALQGSTNAFTATNVFSSSNTFSAHVYLTSTTFHATGSQTVPTITWSSFPTDGIYHHASNGIAFTLGSDIKWRIQSTGMLSAEDGGSKMQIASGTVSSLSLAADTDADTGVYWQTGDILSFAAGGTELARFQKGGSNVLEFRNNTIPYLVDGSASAPSLTWSSDSNTGLYWLSADKMAVAAGGLKNATFGPTNIANNSQSTPLNLYGGTSDGGTTQSSIQFTIQSTTTISTSARIICGTNYGLFLITGNGGGQQFVDLLIGRYSATPVTIGASATGSAATRTYGTSGDQMTLTMGSGTYSIQCFNLGTSIIN